VQDLRERVAAQAAMEKLVSFRGTPEIKEYPFGIMVLSGEAMNWLRGVRGELEMARELGALGPDWLVLHSVPIGDRQSDIDHLVVGPAGVFTINSKRLIGRDVRVVGDRFTVDRYRRDYLKFADFEAKRVEKVLRAAHLVAPIVPVIAVSGARSLRVKNPMWDGRHIGVERVEKVPRRIRRRSDRLTPELAVRIAEVLIDPNRWTRQTPAQVDTAELRAAYESIDRGVTRHQAALLLALFLLAVVGIGFVWWSIATFWF
jgi:hypothetical protein